MKQEEEKLKFETDLFPETGNIQINIFHVLEQLSDEQKRDLLFDGGWWSFIWEDFRKELITGFASENYNGFIYKFRQSFLTHESVGEMLKNFLEGVVRSFTYEMSWANIYRDRNWKYEHIIREYKYNRQSEHETLRLLVEISNTPLNNKQAQHGEPHFVNVWTKSFMQAYIQDNPSMPSTFEEMRDDQ